MKKNNGLRPAGENWSGEATRSQGFAVEETRVDVTIGDEDNAAAAGAPRKERPVWMVESTVMSSTDATVSFFISTSCFVVLICCLELMIENLYVKYYNIITFCCAPLGGSHGYWF